MFILPYQTEVGMYRWPVANFVILGLIGIAFFLPFAAPDAIEALILTGWAPAGLFGYMWLHAGLLHLLGNALFLWLFGNAVCARIGNFRYAFLYVVLGLLAGSTHVLCDGRPAVGASGAINGIVGMYLVLYPANHINCFYWVFFVRGGAGTFRCHSAWMILLWLLFDLWGAFAGGGGTAYFAHLGGFAAGFLIMSVIVKAGWVEKSEYDPTVFDLFARSGAASRRRR